MIKIVGLTEKVKIAGRITTILEEVESGSSAYTFELDTKTAQGKQPDRYFVHVFKSPTSSEQFDISKEDFERLRGMNVPVNPSHR